MSGAPGLLCKASARCLASEAALCSPVQRLPSSAQQCQEDWTDLKLLQLAPRLINLELSEQLLQQLLGLLSGHCSKTTSPGQAPQDRAQHFYASAATPVSGRVAPNKLCTSAKGSAAAAASSRRQSRVHQKIGASSF